MALCVAGCAALPAGAEEAGAPADAALAARRQDSEAASAAAAGAEADRRRAEDALESIRADRLRLNAALLDTTARVRDAEGRATAVEARLDLLTGSAEALRKSLDARRAAIAEILAALERMGLHPPPALLAEPADVLRAIRSSMVLGAAVPGMRAAAQSLASDLAEATRLRGAIAEQRDALARDVAALDAERARLAGLVAARQAAQTAAEGTLERQSQRSADLARQATSLKDLVARLESDVAAAHRAAEAARADAAGVEAKAALAGSRDPARLAPAVAFADSRGRLTLPVAGRLIKSFGATDGYGGQERGLTLATRPGALVTAPADGWVSFAGPYRSYGQLLIIDAGAGYYLVLAGLARTDVVPGQFVLMGEPLGAMGDGSVRTAAAIALGAAQPVLYVEFRKDGAAIDPSPWWAKAELEKVRG